VLHGGVEYFFLRAGDLEGAILFARVIPAIDGLSLRGHKSRSVKPFLPRRKSGVKFVAANPSFGGPPHFKAPNNFGVKIRVYR
jgi:hypothetical protein